MRDALAVAEEDGDLLIRSAEVASPVWAHCRLVPVDLTGMNWDLFRFAPVAVLDFEEVAAQNYGHAVEGVHMPRQDVGMVEAKPADQRCTSLEEDFLQHGGQSPGRRR